MMKFACIVSVVFTTFLLGCSTKSTVHLYGKYLTPEQITQVKSSLNEAAFAVQSNRLEFPATISQNTLIYAPSKGSKRQAEKVISIAENLGFPLDNTGLILASNHSFSADNMGLYLVPQGMIEKGFVPGEQAYTIPLINEYATRDCLNSSTLILLEHGRFRIEEEVWNKQIEEYEQQVFKGDWQIKEGKYLFLQSPQINYTLIFERQPFTREIEEGMLQGFQFLPMSSYSKETNAGRIYCTYEISQVIE